MGWETKDPLKHKKSLWFMLTPYFIIFVVKLIDKGKNDLS